jgi:uncharacterized membrane protein
MLSDLSSNLQLLLRWLHVLAGIIWIGHLYFFNFVNVPFQGTLGADIKKVVNPQLITRALWWFRWGAMGTFLLGLALFMQLYMYTPGVGFGPSELMRTADGVMTGRAMWIQFGMLFGAIMWFNVWFIIWPTQKKILTNVRDGVAVDPAWPKKALLASRINAYLSGPMLLAMLAPSHYGAFSIVSLLVALILGKLAVWVALKSAPRVGTTL